MGRRRKKERISKEEILRQQRIAESEQAGAAYRERSATSQTPLSERHAMMNAIRAASTAPIKLTAKDRALPAKQLRALYRGAFRKSRISER